MQVRLLLFEASIVIEVWDDTGRAQTAGRDRRGRKTAEDW